MFKENDELVLVDNFPVRNRELGKFFLLQGILAELSSCRRSWLNSICICVLCAKF